MHEWGHRYLHACASCCVNTAIKEGLLHRDQYPLETARSRGYSMKRLKSVCSTRVLTEVIWTAAAFPFAYHSGLHRKARTLPLQLLCAGE